MSLLLLWGCAARTPAPGPETTPQEKKDPPSQPVQAEELKKEPVPSPVIQEKKTESEPVKKKPVSVEPPIKKPEELLENALDAYNDALSAWDRGDEETALAALDEAYSLLLKLKIPENSSMVQEKDDLRLLIAQRIQEIYASRLQVAGENHRSIPLDENKHILAEIKNFQTIERKSFEASYTRSGMYREFISEELKKAGLPEELSWMPVIESWFKVTAYSRARALGLWQFISSTGLRYGLKRDRYIDERMDFIKATRAAVKYLGELHTMFGDWTTALAAYNSGEFRVQRVIRAQRTNYLDNFWDLYQLLPRETARFVPRFIATLLIINDPDKYGFELPTPMPPLRFETVRVNKPVMLSSLCQKLGLESGELVKLNPELRHKSTPDSPYDLRVPPGLGAQTSAAMEDVSRYIPPDLMTVTHYVRPGETVSGIAQRYRTSVSAIARLNRLGSRYLIRPGQRLRISSSVSRPSLSLQKEGQNMVYVVKRGDSLYRIANAFNTSVQRIKSTNKLKSEMLRVGQKLVIQSGTPGNATSYTVRSGDTPFEIARKHGMSLDTFLSINGLNRRSKIYPGQKVWITGR